MTPGPDARATLVERLRILGRPDLARHFIAQFLKSVPPRPDARELPAAKKTGPIPGGRPEGEREA